MRQQYQPAYVRCGGVLNQMVIVSSGNVGVSTTSPWCALSVTGTVGFDGLAGSTGAGSLCLDGSKQVVYNSCLSSTQARLEPVSFIYKNGDCRTRYGFIAEDAAAFDAHLATYIASGTLSGIDDCSFGFWHPLFPTNVSRSDLSKAWSTKNSVR